MKKFLFIMIILYLVFNQLYATQATRGESGDRSKVFTPNTKLALSPILLSDNLTIDGVIENSWLQGAHFENFTEYKPIEYRRPKVGTEGYLTYDSDNLYVAFVCQDREIDQLRATMTNRDQIFDDDWVCISIDPNKDYQKAYQLFVNANGIQGDILWQANGTEDKNFDLVWYSDAKIYKDHWIAEMKIPFKSLRFPKSEIQNWSIHFIRHFPRDLEYKYSWMPISQDNNSVMEQAGHLKFQLLKQQDKKRVLEILPYTIATQQSTLNDDPASTQFEKWHYDRPDGRAGAGIKYGLSSNMILDVTYNPDFSQIESDAGQISLNNPYALFFEEKRPFFKEGSDVYAVDQFTPGIALDQFVNLFYSRTINDPLVAGKISGKIGRVNIGYTSALDQNTPYIVPFQYSSAVLTSTKKSYNNILRARYDLGNQSSIGLFMSDRRLQEPGSNTVTAVDARIRLSEKYLFAGIAGYTHTREPDDMELSKGINDLTFKAGDRLRTGGFDGEAYNGQLLRAKLQRKAVHWNTAFAYQDFSPGFRAENGFIMVNGYRMMEYVSSYSFLYDNHDLFSSIVPQVNFWRRYNYEGFVMDTGIRSSMNFNLKNQISFTVTGFLFNREVLQGKRFGDARQIWLIYTNRKHKNVTIQSSASYGNSINRIGVEGDSHNPFELIPTFSMYFSVLIKPTAKIQNSLIYRGFQAWTKGHDFKIMDQHIIRNTLSYQFNKNLSIRLIGEYNFVNYFNSFIQDKVHQNYFTLDPLLSYKLNAFSVFYIGSHLGAQDNMFLNWNRMRLNDQTVYLKFQYLIRSSI